MYIINYEYDNSSIRNMSVLLPKPHERAGEGIVVERIEKLEKQNPCPAIVGRGFFILCSGSQGVRRQSAKLIVKGSIPFRSLCECTRIGTEARLRIWCGNTFEVRLLTLANYSFRSNPGDHGMSICCRETVIGCFSSRHQTIWSLRWISPPDPHVRLT